MLRAALAATLLMAFIGVLATVVTADDDDLTLRSFDVSDITAPHPQQRGPWLGALSANDRRQVGRQDDLEAPKPLLTGDALVEVILQRVDTDSWDNLPGVYIEARGDRLTVRHRADVVRRVESLLHELARAARQRVLLGVQVLEGGVGDVPPKPDGCRITGSLEMPTGARRFVAVTNRVDYVAGYDVEIAQGSSISDPEQNYLDEGLVVEAVAHPLLDGKRLVVEAIIQFGCLGEMRTHDLGVDEEYFAEPFRSTKRFHNGTLQLPICSHVDAHVTAIVESGKDVTIPVVVDGRRFRLRLDARLLGEAGPDALLGLGALTTPSFGVFAGGPAEESEDGAAYLRTQRLRRHDDYISRASGGGIDELLDLVHRGVSPERWEEDLERLDALPGERILVTARPDLLADVRRHLTEFEVEALRPIVLDLELFSVEDPVVSGPTGTIDPERAKLLTAGRVHTISGRWASLRIGSTLNYLADYDVEVAQEARIADPIVGQSFDGLVANLRPRFSLGGRSLSVDLDLLFSVHELADDPLDLGPQYMGPLDQVQARRVELDTTVGVPQGGSTILDAGPDPRNEGSNLLIRLSHPAR